MKKCVICLLIFIFQALIPAFAETVQLKVMAIQDFKTESPSSSISVRILKDSQLDKYELKENDVLTCSIAQIIEPKRGKRDASFVVKPTKYYTGTSTVNIEEVLYGKYSKTVLSKDELKKIKPAKVIKKTALTVGGHFVKGLSTGVAFAEGVIDNEDDNRLKSGVVNAYKESPLSYVENGQQLDIKAGDEFYLVFKIEKVEEPNYSYTSPNE